MNKQEMQELYSYERSIRSFEDEWNNSIPDRIIELRSKQYNWIEEQAKTPGKPIVLPEDFKNNKEWLLGKEVYDAYKSSLDYTKSKFKGYDHACLESIAFSKAYELRDRSHAFIKKSVRNALHNEVVRQSRTRSHEFNISDDNYLLANDIVKEIDRELDDINKQVPGERRPMEFDMRDNKATRFSTAHLGQHMDIDYEFTEWEQVRESLLMYLAFPAGLPLPLMLEMEHLFMGFTLKQKSSLMAYANRTNTRTDEKTIERLCKAYLEEKLKENE
jgi:hypothetical protein